ncbi:C1 family peptidase [uncultured Methanobrevibacter sp.]|uniref:C1 family peptidase n=1 Tax=uncultured Methanobrevibacter sp. TaxID=253161 RepID=UPI0025CE153B|nr:C1 family peptidase [uncultured Methanobrevibacter sp.]
MKALKIMIVLFILIMSVGAVCAAESITDNTISNDSKEILQTVQEDITTDDSSDVLGTAQNDIYTASEDSFTNLTDEIKSKDVVDLTHDYKFNNETDNKNGIVIGKDNFVLNGNGHTIDGKNQSRIFNITANNVTLSNLILTGGNAEKGGAIYTTGSLTLSNVTFIDNYAFKQGAAVGLYENVTIKCDNSRFIDNYAVEKGSAIYLDKGELDLSNTNMTSKWVSKSAQITAYKNAIIYIENAIFADTTSTYSPALYIQRSNVSIINSKFNNLKADITAGAISLKECGEVYIENCEFTNVTSSKNGGAINADIWGDLGVNGNVTIIDTIFKDTSSEFGGAYLQLGGNLFINNTLFTNNHARYNGGSLYLSYVTSNITNCNFTSNGVDVIEGYPTYGGAIFNDIGTLNVDKTNFINNTASAGSAICTYDSSYNIKNSLFENNINPIYTFFDKVGVLDNNVYINDDNISTNNELHSTIVIGQGMQLTLLNNTINITNLPKRFDLRDWGWVSPVRDQGWMGACWTFGMTGALESVILKAAGITSDFSENNMKDSMYRYSIYGDTSLVEGGNSVYAISYLVSWLGALIYDADVYDEMGKISPVITTLNDIHVQDAIFVPNNEIPNGTKLKEAIIKYGSLAVSYYGQSTYDESNPYYNDTTYAQYVDKPLDPNHAVSIVGWDDNFPKENFLITPPGDGAWIVKNSWGPGWGNDGFLYVSYYDQTLLRYDPAQPSSCAATVIFENTVPYNKNYQYAIIGGGNFMSGEKNISYMNVFEALDDDLIAAVGTYFNQEDVNYTVEIYVNDELKLTQKGVSPFFGYHTIKLDDYISIKKGDVFKAIITSNAMPYIIQPDVRVDYTENISFFSIDGAPWADSYKDGGAIVCLKVYTVADDSKIINNKNITVDYDGGKYFSVNVVTEDGIAVAGVSVKFNINGVTKTVKTNSKGVAKIKITQTPKKYTIKTTYNGKTVKNTVTVKQVLTTSKVTVKKTAKKFTLKATLKINGKLVKGKKITFKLNGKTYKVKT